MEATPQDSKSSGNGSVSPIQSGGGDAREKLMHELRHVIDDAETWLKESKARAADNAGQAKARLEDTLRTAKTDLLRLEDSMLARTRIAARTADGYVQDHPWQAVAVAVGAAVGLLAGLLISRDH